ncbi:alpha-L-fucosidase [Flavivirga amylovorans]|uniref:alpha-L-fucosidase n=1 Tax=Flavivirga amylovorans TaxID=870486 RepID=A0ABT8WY18_9FLAO|nr:alpha-L-fucosidase [Flavivirga amylovorans]MDO5986581.1 alpha-L-fucosidase [Flavivirga amylovorans]
MKNIVIAIILILSLKSFSQKKYEANWESIDSRPIPSWYTDAKFGIFIHWGPYSVPAFSKVGEYSEWYWMNLVNPKRIKNGHNETKAFHNKVYGEDFTYPDFVPFFTADMFDADQWADIIKKSGAKYTVLTSKHHDGYTLWPSKEADKSWGRPWSSTNTRPGRDLVGELTTAVRKTDVKMGLYYSIYEWFNPLYTSDVNLYVDNHMVPQFKDLVQNYAPSLIFVDGEWDYPHTTWKSTELLSWLYNDSASKEDVVINDRWGKETRHHHGGYYTTEYGSGMPNADVPWEENRGMAHSFGFSKTENFEDYNSTQQLIYMLVDIVSRGGNFLLDIGPTADGRIPVIMQERLIEIGDWLKVNGEAIYGTTLNEETCQWTKGKVEDAKRGRYKVKYDVMKLTVSPDKGMATKQIMFTKKGNILYGICPIYPKNQLVVKNVKLNSSAKVTLLGYSKPLKWVQKGNNVVIEVPALTASEVPCNYAWTFKLDGLK